MENVKLITLKERMEELGLSDKLLLTVDVAFCSLAIECVKYDTIMCAHGRGVATAIGAKKVRPENPVCAYLGDGAAYSIGMAETIHTGLRNDNVVVITVNNSLYGMTGGQASPMTPTGKKATTAPYGSVDRPFNACALAGAAGATYVARSTAFHVKHLTDMISGGLRNKGFSFIEAMVQCPTAYGRKNKMGDPAKMMAWMRDNAVMKAAWDKLPEGEKQGEKFPIGVFKQEDGVAYDVAYEKVIEIAGGARK